MAAHRRDDEGLRAGGAQFRQHGGDDLSQMGDPAAAYSDRNSFALADERVKFHQLRAQCRLNIHRSGSGKILPHLENAGKFGDGTHGVQSWIRRRRSAAPRHVNTAPAARNTKSPLIDETPSRPRLTSRNAWQKWVSGNASRKLSDPLRQLIERRKGTGERENGKQIKHGELNGLRLRLAKRGNEQARAQGAKQEKQAQQRSQAQRAVLDVEVKVAGARVATIRRIETTRCGKTFPATIWLRLSGVTRSCASVPDSRSRAIVQAVSVTVRSWRISPTIPGMTKSMNLQLRIVEDRALHRPRRHRGGKLFAHRFWDLLAQFDHFIGQLVDHVLARVELKLAEDLLHRALQLRGRIGIDAIEREMHGSGSPLLRLRPQFRGISTAISACSRSRSTGMRGSRFPVAATRKFCFARKWSMNFWLSALRSSSRRSAGALVIALSSKA